MALYRIKADDHSLCFSPEITNMVAEEDFNEAIRQIDEAHSLDPTNVTVNGVPIPYELHYSQKCTSYLSKRAPDASYVLKTAVRAQHFRRWEIPRSSYPDGKASYFQWRTFLKNRQAELASEICLSCKYTAEEAARVASLIKKEDFKTDEEAQVLEDVACLVFLDDQFEAFEKEFDEEKVVRILRKTWRKMSWRGQELALGISMSGRCRELVEKALAG